MIFSHQGISNVVFDVTLDTDELKKRKGALEDKIKVERKKIQILRRNPRIAKYVSGLANSEDFERIKHRLRDLNNSITDFRKQRNREENRKIKLDLLIDELNSLNRSLKEGKVKCSDCGSSNITFTNNDFEFDVSNQYVRNNIITSIKENVKLKEEVIQELDQIIEKNQIEINRLLETPNPDLSNYVLFESEIRNSKEIDNSVAILRKELIEVENKLKAISNGFEQNKLRQEELFKKIIIEITRLYNVIDPNGTMTIKGLFTKSNETFSGSEEQEFYFCKIIAINNILKHSYPIIIDSFREGELSTSKEEKMIEEFIKLNKQIILTSTLKREEYSSDKYAVFSEVNAIDYSQFADSKLLQKDYVDEFLKIVYEFPISI